eukprot:1094730-Pelagomonas_calceolata.AAC.3
MFSKWHQKVPAVSVVCGHCAIACTECARGLVRCEGTQLQAFEQDVKDSLKFDLPVYSHAPVLPVLASPPLCACVALVTVTARAPAPPAMAPATVLVTGGGGLVGKAVQEVIAQSPPANETWVFATSKDADLTNYESAKALFQRHKPTHVLHLAARVGGLFSNMKYKVRGMEVGSC